MQETHQYFYSFELFLGKCEINAFANNSPANIKLSNTQISKIIQ